MEKRHTLLPIVIMLIAGLAASILTYVFKYENYKGLWVITITLVLFYILGIILQKIILRFENQIFEEERRRAEEEGLVLEKEGEGEEGAPVEEGQLENLSSDFANHTDSQSYGESDRSELDFTEEAYDNNNTNEDYNSQEGF